MKKLCLMTIGLMCVMALTGRAEINTWNGVVRFNVYTNNGNAAPFPLSPQVLVQSFTVPAGKTGTKFEFCCVQGDYYYPEVTAIVQIYEVSPNPGYLGVGTKILSAFSGSSDWVAVENLSLEPGTYYAQLYPSSPIYIWQYFGGIYYPGSTYEGGSAAYGWSGGTGVAGDFKCRLTVSPDVPAEPEEPDPAVVNTWSGINRLNVYPYSYNPAPFLGWTQLKAVVQSFAVPDGKTGTKFEFYCVKGGYAQTDVNAVVQIFELVPNAQYVGGATRAMSDFVGSEGWVSVDNLNLEPGLYYAQMFPSNPGATWESFGGKYYTDSTYGAGSAAYGWSGGTAVAGDFKCRLTVSPGLPVAAAPSLTPNKMYISAPTAIAISSGTTGAKIYYTINGDTPTSASTLYTEPVNVSGGTNLKAIAIADGYVNSPVTGMTFMAPTIPIVAFIGIQPDLSSPARYQELREAGFTHNLHQDYTSWPALEAELDMAREAGIKMFVEPYYFPQAFNQFMTQFKTHPALEAYYLKDEPVYGDFASLATQVQGIEALDSSHWCYINLMPNVPGPDYNNYVDTFMSTVGVKVLSFDHYPIGEGSTAPDPLYYQNLEIISSKAKQAHIPFWAFVRTTASNNEIYNPTLGHLRFQAFSDLAYGAQGVQYFTYWARWDLTHALIDPNGQRTVTYDLVKSFNQEIKGLSPVFLGATVLDVSHTGATLPQGTKRYVPSAPIISLTTQGDGAVVSNLSNGQTKYLVIVNRDFINSMVLNLTVDSTQGVSRVFKDGTIQPLSGGTAQYTVEPADIVILKWGRIPGDANGDGKVDVSDLGILAANYGGTGKTWALGDFSGDGKVDVSDLGILAAHYGQGSGGATGASDLQQDMKALGFSVGPEEPAQKTETPAEDSPVVKSLGGCGSAGLPLIASLLLAGLLLVRLKE